jgi:hypothetical protein
LKTTDYRTGERCPAEEGPTARRWLIRRWLEPVGSTLIGAEYGREVYFRNRSTAGWLAV